MVKDATRMVSSVEGGKLNSGFAAAVNKATAGKAGEVQLLGNQIGKADVKVNGDDLEASFTVIDAEGSQKNLFLSVLRRCLLWFFSQLGKAVEENVKAYHKNNQAQGTSGLLRRC
ncbi:hypothetical protein N5V81_13850 [Escherichia coli]|nr:hypothetical protein [Escherichia coli]